MKSGRDGASARDSPEQIIHPEKLEEGNRPTDLTQI